MERSELGQAPRVNARFESSSGEGMQGRKGIFQGVGWRGPALGRELIPSPGSGAGCHRAVLPSAAYGHITSTPGGEVVFRKLLSTFKGSEKTGRVLLPRNVLSRAIVLQQALRLPSEKHSRGAYFP